MAKRSDVLKMQARTVKRMNVLKYAFEPRNTPGLRYVTRLSITSFGLRPVLPGTGRVVWRSCHTLLVILNLHWLPLVPQFHPRPLRPRQALRRFRVLLPDAA